MKRIILGLSVLLTGTLNAQLRLPKIFGDSMVLQRNAPLRIWGWASPAETITVQFHNQNKTVRTNASGSGAGAGSSRRPIPVTGKRQYGNYAERHTDG